jgi:prephenate dehydratase
MLLGTHRVAATTSNKCNRIYLRKKVERSTEPTSDELAARTRFSIVSAQVAQRKKNLATMNQDREAFETQKNTPGGKKTLVSYLWMVVGAAYDAEHPGE